MLFGADNWKRKSKLPVPEPLWTTQVLLCLKHVNQGWLYGTWAILVVTYEQGVKWVASHPSCPDKGHTEHLLYPSGQCHSQTCSSTCRNVFFLFQRCRLSHLHYLHANNSCDHMIPQLAAKLAKIHFCRFTSTCFPSWGPPIAPARPQLQFPSGQTGNGNIIFQQQESSPEFYDYMFAVFLSRLNLLGESWANDWTVAKGVLSAGPLPYKLVNTCDGMKVP